MDNTTTTAPLSRCSSGGDPLCLVDCLGAEACESCDCVLLDTEGGPWGDAMDVILCLFPILFLLFGTLKSHPLPTTVSLPCAALLLFFIRTAYLGSDPLLTCSSVLRGFLEALSPLTIMTGAILLFETMESTLCMPYIMREMKSLTQGHPCAELLLLFSFAYMVEGASGFGTPVALGAPMLASLGYPKLQAVVCLLLMNTFATVWGAAGTPIWFGFGNLGLTDEEFKEISFKAGVALLVAAFLLLPTLVLTKVCKWRVLVKNGIFVFLSMGSVLFPSFGLSFVSYEFPSLIGGMVGCAATAALIRWKVGLREFSEDERMENDDNKNNNSSPAQDGYDTKRSDASLMDGNGPEEPSDEYHVPDSVEVDSNGKEFQTGPSSISAVSENNKGAGKIESSNKAGKEAIVLDKSLARHAEAEALLGPRKTFQEGYLRELMGRTFPLWGTVLLLVLTRIPQIGIKKQLTRQSPNFEIEFGTFGTFRMSASLVLMLDNILNYPGMNWKYELLYVPFLLPFCIISVITMVLYRKDLQSSPKSIVGTTLGRLKNPAVALMGALALVQLLIQTGPASPASIIGSTLSDAFAEGWIAVVAFLGALGSFFSGSTTISNLTFGEIQQIAAENIGTSPTALLALHAAGASAGNGICLNNIIAACAVVGLNIGEGKIIAQTGLAVFCSCVISTVVMLAFFLRF